MYRFVVCDDNPADVAYVTSLIEKWNEKAKYILRIESFSSAEAFLAAYEESGDVDLLF